TVQHLWHRPAIYLFGFSCRAMSGSDREPKFVARIVEVDKLFQALDIAVVKKLLLKVRPGRFSGGTLWRGHRYIARRSHLHLAVNAGCQFYPRPVWVGAG